MRLMCDTRSLVRPWLPALIVAGLLGPLPASGQEANAKYSNWTKVEGAVETRGYKDKLRDGGPFDAAARGFATQVVLPQLGIEANRPTIERVRRRIREVLLSDIADEKAFNDAAKTILDTMAALARNGGADRVVRVNAMLLVGELRAKDNRPLPAAAPVLAAAAGDVRLPLEVRIAAAAGLVRHADAAKAGGDLAAVAKAVAPALVPMLTGDPKNAPVAAVDWLAGRGLAIVQALGPQAGAREAVDAAARILGDASRSIDVRIRAAAALGAAATAGSGVDAARAVESVRGLAIAGLEADFAAVERLRMERRVGGGAPQPGGQPAGGAAGEPTIPALACRRHAWRLALCADAIEGADGAAGLAVLLGKDATAAKDLAAALRKAAAGLDAYPDEQSVVEALDKLGKPVAGAAAAAPRPATPAPSEPPPEAPPKGDTPSPFDGGSPFGQ
jgi:hypothetical protein